MQHVSTMPYLAQGLHNFLAQGPDGITLDSYPALVRGDILRRVNAAQDSVWKCVCQEVMLCNHMYAPSSLPGTG